MDARAVRSLYDDTRKYFRGFWCVATKRRHRKKCRHRKEESGAISETASSFASARGSCMQDLHRPNDWLLDPSLAGEPVVIGLTDRTTSIAEKHDAAQESLRIGFDAGRNRVT